VAAQSCLHRATYSAFAVGQPAAPSRSHIASQAASPGWRFGPLLPHPMAASRTRDPNIRIVMVKETRCRARCLPPYRALLDLRPQRDSIQLRLAVRLSVVALRTA